MSTAQNPPPHTYTNPGTYTVTLLVTDSQGKNSSTTKQITVTEGGGEPTGWGTSSTANANGNDGEKGEPISTATGELYYGEIDLFLGGPLPLFFGRYYASLLTDDGNVTSALGNNWMHNFDLNLVISGTEAKVIYYRGKVIEFEKDGDEWDLKNPEPIIYQLVESGSDYKFMDPSIDLIFTFDSSGKLTSTEDRNGNTLTLTYSGNALSQVAGLWGRTLDFTYTSGKLTQVQDQSGRSLSFSYTGDNLTSYTDALGNETTYSYTTAGNLVGLMTSKTLPEGNTPYTQTFDSEGRVDIQADSQGNTTTLAFDTPEEGVTTVTDPLSNSIEHTHQGQKNLTVHQDQDGESCFLSYDANNRRNGLTDRLGDTTSSTFHEASGKVASYTDAEGNATTYTYTARSQGDFTFYDLTRVDYPDGTSDSMTYNAQGNMLTRTDRAGKIWSYLYNGSGQVVKATNPAGGVTTYTYDSNRNLSSIKDYFGNTTGFEYDAMMRLTQITRPDTTTRSFTYDDNDNLLTVTDERGKVITLTYDSNDNVDRVTDPLGNTITYSYDSNDRLISMVDRLNKTTTLTYDELERLKSTTNPTNETITFNYDAQGWLTSYTDAGGKTTSGVYDKEGVISSLTDPLSNTWNSTTDKLGRPKSLTSPLSNTYNYGYDDMGRLTSYTNPLSQTTSYTYDIRGLLSGITLAGDISASYTRNNLGRITQVTDPNGNGWDRTYDEMGRLTSRTDPLSNATSYTYDSRNRLSMVTFPESTLDITRDEAGNITRRLYSDNTDLQYTYDDNGRVLTANGLSLSYDARGDITDCNGLTITRDDAGRIASITLAPGKTVSYTYNSRGLVSQVSDWAGGGSTDLTYDDVGRLKTVSRPNGVTTTYTYDNDGRLTGIAEQTSSTLSSISMNRNAEGQITSATRNIPLMPDPSEETGTFTYNAANQVSSYNYDTVGRLTADGSRSYSWDLASRLNSYTVDGNTTTFTYDGPGMMISRTSGGVTKEYVWNHALGLPSVSVERWGGSDLRYYIHLPGGWLLYSIEASDNSRHFYHFDEMGTTLFLTDDSGAITDSYGITAYGRITSKSGSTENPFTFLGAYGVMQEGDTGLYYMRARYYDSATARFITRDPVRNIEPREVSPYQYALNNPMRYVDPLGLWVDLVSPRPLIPGPDLVGGTPFDWPSSERESVNKKPPDKKETGPYGPVYRDSGDDVNVYRKYGIEEGIKIKQREAYEQGKLPLQDPDVWLKMYGKRIPVPGGTISTWEWLHRQSGGRAGMPDVYTGGINRRN